MAVEANAVMTPGVVLYVMVYVVLQCISYILYVVWCM